MKKQLLFLFSIGIIALLSSCNFLTNSDQYKNSTQEFTDNILNKNYDKCISLMAQDRIAPEKINPDTIKFGLDMFRSILLKTLGNKLSYTFIKTEKRPSNINVLANSTTVYVQISNNKLYGILQATFDDKSGKIINIQALNVLRPIPTMTIFWLLGIIALCVPVFNIYMIIRVKNSNLKKKWLKYLAIILLNVPTIGFQPATGFLFKLFSLQILLGIGIPNLDLFNPTLYVGIPLGGLYIFWKLRSEKNKSKSSSLSEKKTVKGK